MTLIADPGGQVLYGDWRRRRLTKTDAHLYPMQSDTTMRPLLAAERRPRCGKRIPYGETVYVEKGRPCTDCLVAEITRTTSR